MSISKNLVLALISLGVKQQEIAARAGISQGTVSRILSGQSQPSWKTTKRIMQVAGELAVELRAEREAVIAAIMRTTDAALRGLQCNR